MSLRDMGLRLLMIKCPWLIHMELPAAAEMQIYIETARRRQQQQRAQLRQRREQGFELAKIAARLLREEFGVSRIVLFGSALSDATFHITSDLDLAVWDLPPADYLKAVARLMTLSDFSIDLVEAEAAAPHIQEGIAQGIEL